MTSIHKLSVITLTLAAVASAPALADERAHRHEGAQPLTAQQDGQGHQRRADHRHEHKHEHARKHPLKHAHGHAAAHGDAAGAAALDVVDNAAAAGERAYGWRYFSDPAAQRAVVISPEGDYYYSQGKGLRWVAGTPSGV
jgi:ABC-type Zn2+ transport system substrate-binding protein/surface adhesin